MISLDFIKSATKDQQLPGMVRPMFSLLTNLNNFGGVTQSKKNKQVCPHQVKSNHASSAEFVYCIPILYS